MSRVARNAGTCYMPFTRMDLVAAAVTGFCQASKAMQASACWHCSHLHKSTQTMSGGVAEHPKTIVTWWMILEVSK